MPDWIWWLLWGVSLLVVLNWSWLSRYSALGRFYRSLPPHQNATDLVANMDRLSWFLRDSAPRGGKRLFWNWQYRFGTDIAMLTDYARPAAEEGADYVHRARDPRAMSEAIATLSRLQSRRDGETRPTPRD